MNYQKALPSEKLGTQSFSKVELQGGSVLLVRGNDGKAVAFGTICPHQNRELEEGTLWNGVIDCPHHHHTYNVHTGKNIYPANVFPARKAEKVKGIPIYPTLEKEGWVWVALREEASPPLSTGVPSKIENNHDRA